MTGRQLRTWGIFMCGIIMAPIVLARQQNALTTCIIVRHAEKDTVQDDPDLSVQGLKRSAALRATLAAAHIDAIYSTQFKRTMNSVKELARQRGIPLIVVPHERTLSIKENAERLIAKILAEQGGKTILIASHSNVIPELLRALEIENPPSVSDTTYDDLFIVTRTASGGVSLLHLKYGEKSP